ncbi:MAG: glycosyltransferase family 4 protein [Kiritimatiellae bacterium]|nr:glycosyltransferase family 4 protein [Kiritimatiellia bacterium]
MTALRIAIAARTSVACGIQDYAEHLAAEFPPDVDIRWVDLGACNSSAAMRRAARRANEADAAHVHYEYPLFGRVSPLCNRYAAFMRALNVPAVVTLHNTFPKLWKGWNAFARSGPAGWLRTAAYTPFRFAWENIQYRYAALSIAHTAAIASRAAQAVGADRVWHLPHPVTLCAGTWAPGPRLAGQARFVTPGFIKEHKGYEDALPLLVENPGWTWTLAGGPQDERDGEYMNRLKARIAARGCSDRVRITGYVSAGELERLTREADAALYPFHQAAGSGSLALALGLGMPILATDLPSIRELVEAGAGLLLLDPANPGRWCDPVRRALADERALADMAGANRRFALEHRYATLAHRLADWFERTRAHARAGGSAL